MNIHNNLGFNPLGEWSASLKRVTANNFEGHSYIFLVDTSAAQSGLSLVTQDQYNAYKDSWTSFRDSFINLIIRCFYNCVCSNFTPVGKCSMKDLVEHSKDLIKATFRGQEGRRGLYQYIGNLCLTGAFISEDDVEDDASLWCPIEGLADAFNQIEETSSVLESLALMTDRAREKRARGSLESISGRIQWYIWSYFFDPSRELEGLRNISPTKTAARVFAQQSLLDRMSVNMRYLAKTTQNQKYCRKEKLEFLDQEELLAFFKSYEVLIQNNFEGLTDEAKGYVKTIGNCKRLWEYLELLRSAENS